MKHILVRFSDETGVLLDQKKQEGYSVTGFIRQAVDKALTKYSRPGRASGQHRKAKKRR